MLGETSLKPMSLATFKCDSWHVILQEIVKDYMLSETVLKESRMHQELHLDSECPAGMLMDFHYLHLCHRHILQLMPYRMWQRALLLTHD